MDHQELHKLARLRLSERAVEENNQDLQKFLDWITENELRVRTNESNMDKRLTQFAVAQFEDPEGINFLAVTRVNCAVEFYFPEFKGKMPLMDLSLQG